METWDNIKDISWLMPGIDLDLCLERLDIRVTKRKSTEWTGFCPDHHLFCGREPSHPKWNISVETGETFCHTEGRGSNLVFIAARLLRGEDAEGGLRIEECEAAINFLLGRDCGEGEIQMMRSKNAIRKLKTREEKKDREKIWLEEVSRLMKSGYLSDAAKEYFMSPPDKPKTNITLDTLRHYGVYEKTSGRFVHRAIIPILMDASIRGFIAVDVLGKKKWLESHPDKTEKDYVKTLYPSLKSGFAKNEVLFGLDDCHKGCDYVIITEGAREVMKLWQEGFPDALAILGAYMSDEQIMLLSKLAPRKVVLMFDGDVAGKRITASVYDRLKDLFSVKKLYLPQGVDPKQLGREELRKLIES